MFASLIQRRNSITAPIYIEGIAGTRVFMAIGLLGRKKHSFMHDLESFFWVLFWISGYASTAKGLVWKQRS